MRVFGCKTAVIYAWFAWLPANQRAACNNGAWLRFIARSLVSTNNHCEDDCGQRAPPGQRSDRRPTNVVTADTFVIDPFNCFINQLTALCVPRLQAMTTRPSQHSAALPPHSSFTFQRHTFSRSLLQPSASPPTLLFRIIPIPLKFKYWKINSRTQ